MPALSVDQQSSNRPPSARQLRQFGLILAAGLPTIAVLNRLPMTACWCTALVGGCLGLAAFRAPALLSPLYRALRFVSRPFQRIVTEIGLLLLYFCVYTPTGVLFRLTGRDVMQSKPDPKCLTYWQVPSKSPDRSSYFRQS
ncbi:MAG: hypothetical protein JNL58_10835 [Planctomyces sp.]|nr:hypothetical protein [Planctomyces sp.]